MAAQFLDPDHAFTALTTWLARHVGLRPGCTDASVAPGAPSVDTATAAVGVSSAAGESLDTSLAGLTGESPAADCRPARRVGMRLCQHPARSKEGP